MTLVEVREDKAHKFPNGDYDLDTRSLLKYREHYSKEFFDGLFNKLDVTGQDEQYDFIVTICAAAELYQTFKGLNKEENTRQFQKDRLKKLQNALTKTIETLNDSSDNYFGYPQYFYSKLSRKFKDRSVKKDFVSRKLKKFITKRFEPNDYVDNITAHLEFLLSVSKEIEDGDLHLDRSVARTALARWIHKIGDEWTRYSKVPFITGAYYKNTGYNSEAVIILTDILQKVDPTIEKKNIATELRRYGKVKFK